MSVGYRFPTDREQLRLFDRIEDAMTWRKPITLSYFKDKGTDAAGYRLYVKVTRTVEPHDLVPADGSFIMRCVDRTPSTGRPAYRSIRLDRIAVSRTTNRPLFTLHLKGRYLNPTLLDGKPLHPTKGALTSA